MWIMPSRGRPHLAQRVFSKATPTAPGVVVIDDDQTELYAGIVLPDGWSVLVQPRMFLGPKVNAAVEQLGNRDWWGLINDDMLPETPGWDVDLAEEAGKWGISWADDALAGRIGAATYGGELIRSLGWMCCPVLKHFYIDDVHELIAAELGIGKPRKDIKIPHLHFTKGLATIDQTYMERPNSAHDRAAFMAWKNNSWPILKERLMQEMAA